MAESHAVTTPDLLALTAQIVAAHVGSNTVSAEVLPDLIGKVHRALADAGTDPAPEPAQQQQPAVPVKKSIQPDYLVCLEDGAKVTMLKRYLRRRFSLEPDEYRAKWGLPADYPMVAPNYAARRSTLAKELGLGRKRGVANAAPAEDTPRRSRCSPLTWRTRRGPASIRRKACSATSARAGRRKDEEEAGEAPAATPAPKKRGRKPFAQQSMRPGTGNRRSPSK